MKSKSKLFCCFSVPLCQFLKSKGLRYEIVAKNPNTDKTFWVYIRTPELEGYLTEWGRGPV